MKIQTEMWIALRFFAKKTSGETNKKTLKMYPLIKVWDKHVVMHAPHIDTRQLRSEEFVRSWGQIGLISNRKESRVALKRETMSQEEW